MEEETDRHSGVEMTDGVINGRDLDKLSAKKPPMSYVNIAFRQDSDEEDDDDEGEREVEEEGGGVLSGGAEVKSSKSLKLSPQR